MGHNSQTAPQLGRRPRTTSTTRGTHTLASVTFWAAPISTATTTKSAPLSVSAKRDMSMINQQIHARHAAALINILAREQTKLAAAARLAVENTRSVLAPADMLGTEVLVPSKTLV